MSSSDYSSSKTQKSKSQKSKSRFNPYRKRMFDVLISITRNEYSRIGSFPWLRTSLREAGVYVFEDDIDRRSGELTLRAAIAESRISIIVFTTDYAASTFYMKELEKIMECRRTVGQQIVPVFYGVDPSEVRKQTDHVREAFTYIDRKSTNDENKVLSYNTALQEAAGISPRFVVTEWVGGEGIKNIVEHVTSLLDSTDLFVAEHSVGVQSRVQKVIQILNYHKSDDVLLLGIWGMGGIGKTTIAKAIYNQISHNFELRKFLSDLRYRSISLRQELISFALPTNSKNRRFALAEGDALKYLSGKRSFFVFDNVNDFDHMNQLIGLREWYGPGSIIIITTRNKEVLRSLRVDHIYRVDELDYNECVELFSWYAFQKATPERNFAGLIKHVVEYSDGLPLALVALGSTLFERNIEEWESILDQLKRFSIQDVREVLEISIDDLAHKEKQIFLEFANLSYFFVGMGRNDIMQILKCSGYDTRIGIELLESLESLEDQSLVTFNENKKLCMHPLLQDLGREIYQHQSSIGPQQRTYDVFLSFRGEDTRSKFTSHLHASLENAGIYVFKDDDGLSRGQQLSLSLLKAIGESKISIIVLSTNYANSRWCLQELEDIMICYRTKAQKVLPVFYNVDPSEVRNQTGEFGQAFQDLIKTRLVNKDKEQSWRKALRVVGSISGFVFLKSSNESEDIKKIVEHVTHMLDMKDLFIANHPVGVESRVQDVIELLKNQPSENPILLGILGMGGIGKTTIAKAVYNKICREFEGRCFLLNIREVWDQGNGGVHLQWQLLSDIYETLKIKIRNIESGKSILERRLREKRILLVLDDVDKLEQLNALAASHEWFCPRSVIIITTRDEHLLSWLRVDKLYRMETLDDEESIELFSWHAFKEPCPRNEFAQLSSKVISYCGRLPLALEVIGSHLFNRGVIEWMSVLKKLKNIPHEQVQKKLKISFDGLSEDEYKEIFLDIAFFFIGMEKVDAINILNGCGHPTTIGVSVLIEKCLLYVDTKNKLRMHDLLRDMGREIIREKSPKAPEKRSRVWHPQEVCDLLSKDMATKAIEGLALKLQRTDPIHLKTEVFKNMKRLKLLQLAGVQLDGDFKYLSTDIRWLCWHGCPSTYTTAKFDQGNLVAIDLKCNNLQLLWKEGQLLEKLKILNLSHSKHLTQTPDFSYLPKLQKLMLKYCPSLSSICHTIGHLKQVLLINLKGCTSLQVLPRSIYELKSLKTLILSGCSNIDKLEEDLEQMESLETLLADDTAITHVPHALIRLKSIGYISMCGFEGLSRNVIPSIIWSWTSPTNNLSPQMQTTVDSSYLVSLTMPNSSFQATSSIINELPNVQSLGLECCSPLQTTGDVALSTFNVTNFKELEAMTTTLHVSKMDTSTLVDCRNQGDISESKSLLNSILIQMGMKCPVTEILRESILQELSSSGSVLGDCLLPGDNDPNWSTFSSEGFSVFFHVPQLNGRNLKAMMLCIIYSSSGNIVASESLILENVLINNQTKAIFDVYRGDTLTSLKDEDWQRLISNLEPSDKVQVFVCLGRGFIVKKTTVYLIYEEPIDQNIEHFHADDFVSCHNKTASGGDDCVVADMNENASDVDDMARYEDVIVSGVHDVVADMHENAFGVNDMARYKNVTVSSVNDVAADGNVIASDMPIDSNDDIISSGDETRFSGFFNLHSIFCAVFKKCPFCHHSNKRRKFNLISRCKQRWKWLVKPKSKLTTHKKANKAQCFKLWSWMD